jgi:hypothetical protein
MVMEKKRTASKRDLVKAPNANFYAKRTPGGQFKEMDEVGRSLAADRRQKAKSVASPGYGDQGDQKRSPKKKP